MKSVLISIQPYWVFLIIANKMGWNIGKEKTIEVRKNYPKDENWDKVAKIYCSKDKKSFAKIPKEYQPLMEKFLGKVIGEFVCDRFTYIEAGYDTSGNKHLYNTAFIEHRMCIPDNELHEYLYKSRENSGGWAWHISNLVIYDKPRELSEFRSYNTRAYFDEKIGLPMPTHEITRPFQSWGYVYETDT